MEGQSGQWLQRLNKLWGGFSPLQRIGIIAGFLTLVGVALVATLWTKTPDYAALFSGLSEQDAAAVVEQLKAQKIPYQLEQGGATILVPARQVYDARLQMATQGLPKGSTIGFELFDGNQLNSLSMTDFMQRVNYQRALEGELARTIGSLAPVASARVHIVVPEASLFLNEQRDPTASVVLQLKPRNELSREQVQAVIHLVASSVEGLKPNNITLVDMLGTVLSAGGEAQSGASGMQASNSQLDAQRSFERDMENRLQIMLDQALGPDHAIVRVSATLNWDQKQINSETYSSPSDTTGVVRSEQTQEESYDGNGTGPGGVPGVDSNTVPGYPLQGTPGANSANKYAKKTTTRNYELSKVVQTVTQAPGTVQRLNVAVALDDKMAADTATQIQTMVATATGLDTSRGDTVTVQRIPFAASAANLAGAADQVESNRQLVDFGKLVIMILVVLIVLRFTWLIFRDLGRRLNGETAPYLRVVTEEEVPPGLLSAPPAQLAERTGAAATASHATAQPALPEVPKSEENPVQRHLMDLATRRPELLADLIQSWLAEP